MKKTAVWTYVLPVLLMAAAIPAWADRQEEEPERYEESLEVRIREVEVFVTDRKGNTVKGLTRDDFKLFENKIPLDIRNFYAVEGGLRVEPGPGDPALLDELPETAPPTKALTRPALNLIIYVDNYNLRPHSRNRIFESLKSTLGDLVSGNDRVMVVSFDRGLKVRQPFTTDIDEVVAAIEEVEQETAGLNWLDSERRDLLGEIAESDAAFLDSLVGRVEAYADSVEQDVKFTLGALKYFVGALAGINGRKALLYVSDGLPMVAGEEMFYALTERADKAAASGEGGLGGNRNLNLRSQGHDTSDLFQDLAAYASANKVTFYTVDAGGLRNRESIDVVYRTSAFTTDIDSIARQNLQASLHFMAEQTGGRAFVNSNDFDQALELVFADMDAYYSLGYKPVYSDSNPYYKIRVKVKGRGLKTRYRRVSLHKGTGEEMVDGIRATLLFGQADNAFDVRMAFGTPQKVGKDDYVVPTVVAVPLESIFFTPGEGYHEARLNLSVAARDDRGWMTTVNEMPVPPPIRVEDDNLQEARSGVFYYKMKLAMKEGDYTVAVGVRDEATAIAAYGTASVDLGKD